jgi:hypothetical protein
VPNVFPSSRGPHPIFLVKVTVPFYSPKMTFFHPQRLTLENYPSASLKVIKVAGFGLLR